MMDRWTAQLAARCCFRCGAASWNSICSDCRNSDPCHFESPQGHPVVALGLYEQAPGAWVRRLKYQEESVWAAALGHALAQVLPADWSDATLIPVPLHPDRLVERGFNQSALIARSLAHSSSLSLDCSLLHRSRKTSAQARLAKAARRENLQDAFACTAKAASLRAILLDDVVTTGHTLDACALALKAEGHQVLGGLTCAVAQASEPKAKTR